MEKYSYLKVIGTGNYGKAWLVRSRESKRHYVVKEINVSCMNEKDRNQAVNEVAILGRLKHKNIIRYREAFVTGSCGVLAIVMEYADGGDLAEKISAAKVAGEGFSEYQVLNWFVQLCLALYYIHSEKILHRDLKPSNLFLTSNDIVKVGDFGIARTLRDTLDHANTAIGTPYYLSPEICQRQPYNQKSDMWAAGCILYELLTLNHPFDGQDFSTLILRILHGAYTPIAWTYGSLLDNLVGALLSVDPDRRPSARAILTSPDMAPHVKAYTDQREAVVQATPPLQPDSLRRNVARKPASPYEDGIVIEKPQASLSKRSPSLPYYRRQTKPGRGRSPLTEQSAMYRKSPMWGPIACKAPSSDNRYSRQKLPSNSQEAALIDSPELASQWTTPACLLSPESAAVNVKFIDDRVSKRISRHQKGQGRDRPIPQGQYDSPTAQQYFPLDAEPVDSSTPQSGVCGQSWRRYYTNAVTKVASVDSRAYVRRSEENKSTKRRSCTPTMVHAYSSAVRSIESKSPYTTRERAKRRQSLPVHVKDSKLSNQLVSSDKKHNDNHVSYRYQRKSSTTPRKAIPGRIAKRRRQRSMYTPEVAKLPSHVKASRAKSDPMKQVPHIKKRTKASREPGAVPPVIIRASNAAETPNGMINRRRESRAPITCLFPRKPKTSSKPRTLIKHGTYTLSAPTLPSNLPEVPANCERCGRERKKFNSTSSVDQILANDRRKSSVSSDVQQHNNRSADAVVRLLSSVANLQGAKSTSDQQTAPSQQVQHNLGGKTFSHEKAAVPRPDIIPSVVEAHTPTSHRQEQFSDFSPIRYLKNDSFSREEEIEVAEIIHAGLAKDGEVTSDLRAKLELLKMYLERRLGPHRTLLAYDVITAATDGKKLEDRENVTPEYPTSSDDVVKLMADVLGPGKIKYFPIFIQVLQLDKRCH